MLEPLSRSDPYGTGLALAAQGRHADAIARFEQALRAAPGDIRILFALGNTARALGETAAAESFYRRVLAAEPARLEAVVHLANLLSEAGRTAEAIALLTPAIQSAPESPELWLTLGSACRAGGDAERAELFFREALRLRPDYPPALGNLADLIADGGNMDEALALYGRVLAKEPHNAQAHLNRAILHLLRGELVEGWRDYEHRLKLPGKAILHDHGLKRWNGKAWRKGMRLLVTAEQGLGDQIAFASLIPDLAAAASENGASLLLEAEPRLVDLFARSFPGVSVHASRIQLCEGARRASYDWLKDSVGADKAIALASLPSILRRSLDSFVQPHAYLKPEPAEQARWRNWFGGQGQGPFIGLCWRSGNVTGLRAIQYAPLEAWGAFARDLPGTLVSVQYDAAAEEIETLQRLSGRTLLVPPGLDQKQEIDRATAMMSCLDAVVSAPTAVSWMSAAAGTQTFKILYANSWTSFGRNYEPLAPAAHAVTPRRRGDWDDAFAQVRSRLRALSDSDKS